MDPKISEFCYFIKIYRKNHDANLGEMIVIMIFLK